MQCGSVVKLNGVRQSGVIVIEVDSRSKTTQSISDENKKILDDWRSPRGTSPLILLVLEQLLSTIAAIENTRNENQV